MSNPVDSAALSTPALPDTWSWARFDDTCEPISDGGRKVPQKAYLKGGRYPIVDQGEALIGGFTDDDSMVFQGTTPLIAFGDHTRRFKLIEWPFVVGADGVKLIAPTPAWNVRCLWYFLRALRFEDRGYSRHFQFLRRSKLPLPPLSEQARIVDALDEHFSDLDAGVAALEKVRDKLKLLRASVLKVAVEGTLTAEWRAQHPRTEPGSELLTRVLAERRRRWENDQLAMFKAKDQAPPLNWKAKYREPIAPDATGVPPLPDGWCIASMDALTLRITSGSRDWQRFYGQGSGTFIMAQNVRPGRFDPSIRQSVNPPKDDPSCERSLVQPDDLLVTIVGANTGDVCRVPASLTEHYVCQSVALMRPVERRLAAFLDYYCNSPGGAQLHYGRYIYGAGRPHLSFDQLKMMPVLLPPLAEQEALIEAVENELSIIDHLEADLDAKLKNAQSLRHAILRHAFTGQLVPQDPNDEPASELLQRIAAERNSREASTRRRRTTAS